MRESFNIEASKKDGPMFQQLALYELTITFGPGRQIKTGSLRLDHQREPFPRLQIIHLDQVFSRNPHHFPSISLELVEIESPASNFIHNNLPLKLSHARDNFRVF